MVCFNFIQHCYFKGLRHTVENVSYKQRGCYLRPQREKLHEYFLGKQNLFLCGGHKSVVLLLLQNDLVM